MAQTRLSRRGGLAAGIPLPGAIRRAGGSHAPLRVPGIFERSGSHRSETIEQIRTERSAGWQPVVSPIVNRQTAGLPTRARITGIRKPEGEIRSSNSETRNNSQTRNQNQ